MNYIYPCKAFLRKRLNMTKVIGLLRGNGPFGVHLACSNEVDIPVAIVPPEFAV
jgi:hypothetical protein